MSASAQRNESNTLFDEILELQAEGRPSTCTVKAILDAMTPADRAAIVQAFNTPTVMGTSIAKVLKKRGFPISSHTLQRHRRGGCSCEEVD